MTRIRKMDADTLFALAMKGAGPDLRAWLRKKKHQPRVWAVFKEAARALEKKRGSHGVKPTVSSELNQALGIGGIPIGQLIEVGGPLASQVAGYITGAWGNFTGVGAHTREQLHMLQKTVKGARRGSLVTVSGLGAGSDAVYKRQVGRALRQVSALADRNGVTVLFIDEEEQAPQSLKSYASIRIKTRLPDLVKVEKNKFAPPFESFQLPHPQPSEGAIQREKERAIKAARQSSKVTMRMAMQFGAGDERVGLNGVGWLPWSGEAWEWPAEGVLYASDGYLLGAIPVAQAPERPVFWSWSDLTERAGKAGKAGKGSPKKQAIRALGSLTPEAFLDKMKDVWRPQNPDPVKIFSVVPLVGPTRLDTGALYRLLKQYKWRSLLGTIRPGVELSWGPGEAVTVSFYQAIRRKDKAQVNGPVRDIWGTGKHKKTAFNPRYLRQVCKHFPGSRTQIRTASHLGPFMIARPDYFAIIMPMRADEGFPRKRTVEVPAKITWGKTQTIKATEKQADRKGLKTVELKGKAVQGVVDRTGEHVTIWRVPSRMSGWAWAPVPLREIEPAQFLDPKTAASGNKKLTKTEAKRQAEVFEGTAEDSVDDVTQRLLDQAKNTRAKPGGPVERTVVAAAQSTGKVSKKSGEVVRKALRYPLFVGGWSNALVYATPRHLRSRVGRAFNAHVMRALVRMLQQGEARFRTIPTDVALRRFSPRASAVAGGPTQYVLELTDR